MKPVVIALAACLVMGCDSVRSPSGNASRNSTDQADNTARNTRDRDNVTKTPVDQNEDKHDVEVTAAIRKQVVDAKLSTDAENVKIITQDGQVTLRGPVDSAAEKSQIEKIAVTVAGAGRVDNQLEVKQKN